MNHHQSPTGEVTPRDATCRVKKRLAALAWITVILPPLALPGAVGLGVYIDGLALGPRGFFFVLVLIGPGAWAIALACAAGVVELLSQGSLVTKILLWALEILLCLFAYSLVMPLLGPGWG